VVNVCKVSGGTTTNVASEGMSSGRVLYSKVTFGGQSYVVAFHYGRISESDWEDDCETIQNAYWDDVSEKIGTELNLVLSTTSACQAP
jgi:hypothetical protein